MSILVDANTKVICQGFTGSQGTFILNKPSPTEQRWWAA